MGGARLSIPTLWPHPTLKRHWEELHRTESATQPHIQSLLYHLVCALDVKHAVELGVWKGATSRWLACAIEANGGGTLTLVDTVEENVTLAADRCRALELPHTTIEVRHGESLFYLESLPTDVKFVFLDDDKQAIDKKLDLIKGRGVIVAIHDIEVVPDDTRKKWRIVHLPMPAIPSGGDLGLVVP